MSKRPSITCAVIAKNEENNVKQWFNSIDGVFDEVVFVDTGSVDGTVDIAKSLGCKVSHFDWIDDFSAARNFSFDQVKTDYVFWNDLDDVLVGKDQFIDFRDNVMNLYDYWVAKYDYSSNAEGKPMCSFARERVMNMAKGMRWRYPIHEGIIPVSKIGQVRLSYINTWSIKHMRTEEDLKKDRSRNLGIFEKERKKAPLDARMLYYYGKELYEIGRPLEAVGELLKALAQTNLELHDRVLGFQYLCYAYMACNQFEKAIEQAHTALMIAPNRAEFFVIIGDCFVKMGRIIDAIPMYYAAKNCINAAANAAASPIFSAEDCYSTYPSNHLVRCYFHLGDFEKARALAKENIEKFNSPESKMLLTEMEKAQSSILSFKTATACEDIVITCPPVGAYEWDADIAKQKSMGGSETAAIEMAHWLHKLSGRPVKLFNVREKDIACDGVEYISNKKLTDYMGTFKPWLHIAWRHNIKCTDAPTFLWCHDLFTPGMEHKDTYKKIMALTPFHAKYLTAAQGIPNEKVFLTSNGIKPERFTGSSVKNPNKIVFPNSPDRGLDRAMRVLDKVREEFPDLELHVFYGIEHLPKYGHQKLHDELKIMMGERPWVKYHGGIQQEALMQHFKEAVLWVYPSDWYETSCISALEILGCGVYPIVRRIGGIVDTLASAEASGMASIINSECITENEYSIFIEETKKALREKRWEGVKIDTEALSWQKVAQSWLDELPKFF